MKLRVASVVALTIAFELACRSAGGPAPATPGAGAEAVRALVGERRILRFDGRTVSITVKAEAPAPSSAACDVVVEVRSAGLVGGAARFSLAPVGLARLERRPGEAPKKAPCRELPANTALVISGLEGAPPEKVATRVGKFLLTVDDYLRASGLKFDRAPGPDATEVADRALSGTLDEQRLARAITTPEHRLLAFDPVYRPPNPKPYFEAEVEFVAVVDVDGRLHAPRMKTPLGEHEERVVRLLSLWRYEPARRGDAEVAVRIVEKTVLRIY